MTHSHPTEDNHPQTLAEDGLELIANNLSRHQQWAGTHLDSKPTSTTLALNSLLFTDPEPSKDDVQAMLSAAVGNNGYAMPAQEAQTGAAQPPLWTIECYSISDREALMDRVEAHKAQREPHVVNPSQIDASLARPRPGPTLAL